MAIARQRSSPGLSTRVGLGLGLAGGAQGMALARATAACSVPSRPGFGAA